MTDSAARSSGAIAAIFPARSHQARRCACASTPPATCDCAPPCTAGAGWGLGLRELAASCRIKAPQGKVATVGGERVRPTACREPLGLHAGVARGCVGGGKAEPIVGEFSKMR